VRPLLFDSSIYILALRGGAETLAALRRLAAGAPLWLSAVVLAELYAGAIAANHRAVERLERDFTRARRILVPNAGDWAKTGKILSGLALEYGYEKIGQGRLTNDALIAVSAGRVGVAVMTANRRDFSRLAEFCSFRWSEMSL
jgi:predicted nucleic acid-binding protein